MTSLVSIVFRFNTTVLGLSWQPQKKKLQKHWELHNISVELVAFIPQHKD